MSSTESSNVVSVPAEGTDQVAGAAVPVAGRQRSRGWRTVISAPATYLLIALNVLAFLAMWHAGADPRDPTPLDLLRFGACNTDLVLQGEWWRIVTAMFLHVGLLHLALNMWCLWNLGLFGEPLLGFLGTLAVYLLTGAAGNLLSVAVGVALQEFSSVEAGASGAVFGIAGILIVLFSNKELSRPRNGEPSIAPEHLKQLRRSVLQFAGLNLFLGIGLNATQYVHLGSFPLPNVRISNAAHIGGLISGLALGLPLLPRMTSGRKRYLQRQKVTFAAGLLLMVLLGYGIAHMR